MQAFLHQRLQALTRLQALSSAVLTKFNRLDLDLAAALSSFLDEAVQTYRALNQAGAENRLLALQAQTVSAAHGTHPDTLAQVASHRRALLRAVALRVLQQSAEQVRTDIERDQRALDEARTQLRPMLLAAYQHGLLALRQRKPYSAAQLDKLWLAMVAHPELQLAARQLALRTSVHDLLLLLAELVDAARASLPAKPAKPARRRAGSAAP